MPVKEEFKDPTKKYDIKDIALLATSTLKRASDNSPLSEIMEEFLPKELTTDGSNNILEQMVAPIRTNVNNLLTDINMKVDEITLTLNNLTDSPIMMPNDTSKLGTQIAPIRDNINQLLNEINEKVNEITGQLPEPFQVKPIPPDKTELDTLQTIFTTPLKAGLKENILEYQEKVQDSTKSMDELVNKPIDIKTLPTKEDIQKVMPEGISLKKLGNDISNLVVPLGKGVDDVIGHLMTNKVTNFIEPLEKLLGQSICLSEFDKQKITLVLQEYMKKTIIENLLTKGIAGIVLKRPVVTEFILDRVQNMVDNQIKTCT